MRRSPCWRKAAIFLVTLTLFVYIPFMLFTPEHVVRGEALPIALFRIFPMPSLQPGSFGY
jgi:hypothetical protein